MSFYETNKKMTFFTQTLTYKTDVILSWHLSEKEQIKNWECLFPIFYLKEWK